MAKAAAAKKETKEEPPMVNQLPAIKEPGQLTIEDRKKQTDEIIETATHWAMRLMEVVDRCGLSKQMSGKKYLEVEGWLMISEFAHVRPVIEWVRPWMDEDKLFGYEARCQLLNDDGQVIGAGESSCGLDAFPCRGKQGSEKDKAAKSAAQTWAISRALRNKFSYVAKIAGYQAVPAEEMHSDITGDALDNTISELRGAPKQPPPRQLSKAHVDLKAGIEQYVKDNPDPTMTNEAAFAEILKVLTQYDAYYHKTQPCPECGGKKCDKCGKTGKRLVPGNPGVTELETCSDAMAGAALRRFRERLAEKAREEEAAKAAEMGQS